jgi:hypothetical protein
VDDGQIREQPALHHIALAVELAHFLALGDLGAHAGLNFNPMMATAAEVTVAQVEHLVEPGEIDPDHIHTPGIFIGRILHVPVREKRIEQRTVRNGSRPWS